MVFFKNLKIKEKLALITLLASVTGLLIAGIGLIIYDQKTIRQSMVSELSILALIIADRSTAAMVFNDKSLVRENLGALKAKEPIVSACIYDKTGALFVTYNSGGFDKPCPTEPENKGYKFTQDYLHLFQPILIENDREGTLYIRSDLREIKNHFNNYAMTVTFAIIIAGVIVFLFSSVLQKTITKPLLNLAEIADRVSRDKDFSIRATKDSQDELGSLVDRFNEMLFYVQERDAALMEAHDFLEKRVKERTKELQQEIDERMQAEKNIIKAKEEAEKASRAKSEFLSSMSHELRTPLNAILGFSDLLKGLFFGKLNEKQSSYVSLINSSGQHLLDLINDILELSKIDAGKVQLHIKLLSPKELIEETLELMKPEFNKKQLEVTSTVDPALKTLTADKRRFKQIMLNLLSNAVKYTPEKGRIEVVASDKEDHVHISVSDTGIGISQEEQEKIFSEFYQADRARDEALGGTGIGLALTRRLVELHGGEIGVESNSQGSTFWFNLPHKILEKEEETQTKEAIQPEPTAKSSHRILVAEDNEINLTMLLDMLSINNHKVYIARNGQEAIDLALANKPELIFMDIRMPVMDGLEATRRLRAMPEFSKVPIIALTASVGEESKEKCFAAGCTEHLAKPIQSKELFAALHRNLT